MLFMGAVLASALFNTFVMIGNTHMHPFLQKLFGVSTSGELLNNIGSWFRSPYQNQIAAQDFNAQQTQNQYDEMWKMWNANNAYNTPAAQMQRVRDAGLNPSLLYGQPISESQPMSGFAEASVSPAAGGVSPNQLMQTGMQMSLIPEQIELLRAQADEVRSRIPVNESRVSDINNHARLVGIQAAQAGVDLSIAEQTMPSVVSSAIAKNNFDKASNEAALQYVNKTAKVNFDILDKQLDNLKKDGLIKDEIYKQEQEKLKSLRAKATLDEYAADNKEADFWIGRIDSLWDLIAAGVVEFNVIPTIKEYSFEAKEGFKGMMNGFKRKWNLD